MKKFLIATIASLTLSFVAFGAPLVNGGIPNTFSEKPTMDALKALKATVGKPFNAGYVFIDGRYISPPYTVQRYGTVIRINNIQVTGEIVPWGEFAKTQEGVQVTKSEVPVESETPAETPEPAPAQEEEEEETFDDSDASLDDLFADEPTVKKKKPTAKKRVVSRPKPKKPVATITYSFEGEFVPNLKTRNYLKTINAERTKIDSELRKGGFYFFGSRYSPIAGNANMAKFMLSKMPSIMKREGNADAFSNALRKAGFSYMPTALMEDLFRNRIGYILLERRAKADNEAKQWSSIMGDSDF